MTYMYQYVEVKRIVDGDTVELEIDLGNHVRWSGSFRLNGIDTPERGQLNYKEASEFLVKLLSNGITKIITSKPDKYGRWLVDIWVPSSESEDYHVNTVMVSSGFAKSYFGGRKI